MKRLERLSRHRERQSQKKEKSQKFLWYREFQVSQGTIKVANKAQRSSKARSEKGSTEFGKWKTFNRIISKKRQRQKIVYRRLKSKELEGEQLSHYIKLSVKMFANKFVSPLRGEKKSCVSLYLGQCLAHNSVLSFCSLGESTHFL